MTGDGLADLENQGPGAPAVDEGPPADPERVVEISGFVTSIVKAAKTSQLYQSRLPLVERFLDDVAERLGAILDHLPNLNLAVTEGQLLWRKEPVYDEPLGTDNLAFALFKNGIRQINFLPGSEEGEIRELVGLLQTRRGGDQEEQDLLTVLWQRDFQSIQFDYVNEILDGEEVEPPRPDREAQAGQPLRDLSEVESAREAPPPSSEDGDVAHYNLSDADVAYLRREMQLEWERPLKRDVTLALLDQFEMRDQERRRQVVEILRELLPRLLRERDFSNAALILNELQLLANKTGEVETQELVTALLRDMSEAVAEMVSAAEDVPDRPAAGEITALLGALQAEAIPTLVRAVPAVGRRDTRRQLMNALDRLVAAHPGQVHSLLQRDDPVIVAETAKIVGRLKLEQVVPDLVPLMNHEAEEVRLAATQALAAVGSESMVETLAGALDDPKREVRLTAARALGDSRSPVAASALARWVTPSRLDRRDLTEQVALLKSYAFAAGEEAIEVLNGLLNGRKWWGGRYATSVRAGAARALGLIPSERARRALDRASGDRNGTVRSAALAARRAMPKPEDVQPQEQVEPEQDEALETPKGETAADEVEGDEGLTEG